MKHLGDISKINGAGIAPVDIITFGSPCQDLSVAGKQAGLDGERSGLFMEAVRIIKEMRDATNGKQPRFAVWENVPGAFSSNKGADFQTVLLELCKITEPKAPAVAVPKAGWPPAGQLTDVGGGSIAYRTIDAQFHGVPQRRRRIILVCDFAGQRAGDLLFKPKGLPGYPAPGVCEGQAAPGAAAVGPDSPVIGFAYKASSTSGSVAEAADLAPTLLAARNDAAVCLNDQGGRVTTKTRPRWSLNGGGENNMKRYTVRRLTPTECARLQGFPGWWAAIPTLADMTDEAFDFWQEVRRTHAAVNGKTYKPAKTKKAMINWYNKLHTDSAEYKMWGNGVALPVVRIPLHGMAQLGAKTLGSLFDGSGGFPLAGLLDGIETLWASEIEPYPIAVTEWNFRGKAQLLLGGTAHE